VLHLPRNLSNAPSGATNSKTRFVPLSAAEENKGRNYELAQGNILFKQEKYEEAVELYNKAVSVNGTQPVYMSNLAATYLKLEEYGHSFLL
jgi:Flp pilus assembly protein TadD